MECCDIRDRSLDLANLTKPDIVCIVDNICYYSSVYLATLFIFALGYRPTLLRHTTG